MAFELPQLPYAPDALEPHISARTMNVHHGKHHKTYVDKLNALIQGTEHEGKSLEEVILSTAKQGGGVFNNAAQVWNHSFFWRCLKPGGSGAPTGELALKINSAFDSFDAFKREFQQAAAGQFGSGWAWLVWDGGKVGISTTPNAHNPMAAGDVALFTVDVWEHAYYLDYQNRRPDFVKTVLDELADWEFAERNLNAVL